MKKYSKIIAFFTLTLLIQSHTLLQAQPARQLAQLTVELTFLKNLLTRPITPEELVDIELEKSSFSTDLQHRYPLVEANKTIARIEALIKLKPTPEREAEAQDIVNDLLAATQTATGTANAERLATLLAALTRLMILYPFTIKAGTRILEKINQYVPAEVFNNLISILAPSVREFSREITKELTRNALSLVREAGRQEHRRFIREALEKALMYMNLILDQYFLYKDYPSISLFDKNQFFSQILFNWQIIKKGYNSIKNELSPTDKQIILDNQFNLPTIDDPRKRTLRSTENYYQETRARIEGLGEAVTVVKPLRILIVKIDKKLAKPTKVQENAVKNFARMQLPRKIDESAAFLEYNYSEFSIPAQARIIAETLKKGAKDGIKGSPEATIIHQIAEEIEKYEEFRRGSDELDELINQMKKDPSKFATTDTIDKIIKKIDEVGKKSDKLADPSLRRDKKEDKKLKEELEKTKKSIHTGAKLGDELAVHLQDVCVSGRLSRLEQVVEKEVHDKAAYRNLVPEQQVLVLQAILGHLIKELYNCVTGASDAIRCNICTYGAAWVIARDILSQNPQAPGWVRTFYGLGYAQYFPKNEFQATFENLIT